MAAVNRRAGAAAVVLLAAMMALAWYWRSAGLPAAGPIVFISIDTLRADRLPAYGSTRIRTPHIDALAADGAVFERAYAHSPQTLPSHTSILSGQLPFEHGVRDNIGFTLKGDQRLLPHALRERGYATAAFVSSYVLRRQTGIGSGFDTYDDQLPAASAATPLGQVQRPGELTVSAAVRWLDAQTTAKVFLFTHLFEPHTPYEAPARFTGLDPYDAEVAYADEIVGTLLTHLRQKNLYDAATIVLFADHGEGLGDHGEDEHGIFLYRETIQVPLIVKLPASRNGRRVSTPVQHIDLAPTVLAIAGATGALPAGRGRSLLPLLHGSGEIASTQIYSESQSPRLHFGWSELYALTDDRYRYIRAPREELYDVRQDPSERMSVVDAQPHVRNAMYNALDALKSAAAVNGPTAISDDDRRRLASLGYVGLRSPAPTAAAAAADPKDKIHVFQGYRRATQLAAAGQHAAAAVIFRDLLREDNGMTDVWLQLAAAYERQGRYPDAFAAYQEVIARQPKDPAALTGAANALLRTGRLDEARAHAELAATVAPATAHELLARLAVGAGDAAAARRHAQLAREADATLPLPAFVDAALLYREGRYERAAELFLEVRKAAAGRTEQLADVNYLAADSLARLERYREAEPLFLAELALTPEHIRARAGLAMLYQATGRTAAAAAAVADIARLAPTAEAFAVTAELWEMFGEPQKAAAARARARRAPG